MRSKRKLQSGFAMVSIAAALASPTFGLNITFDATRSNIVYLHDAEFDDANNGAGFTRTTNPTPITGTKIPKGSAPGYQLSSGTVFQSLANGTQGTGSSTGRIGIGHLEDTRTATMTVQSLTFVNQNEVDATSSNPNPELMNGASFVKADFQLVWRATGAYGPPLVGRVSIPLTATVDGGGSASVELRDVKWRIDYAADGVGNGILADGQLNDAFLFEARTEFDGTVNFGTGTTSQTLASSPIVLKNQTGGQLVMQNNDYFILSGSLIFSADGNSPASTLFEIGDSTGYEDAVLGDSPLRFYRLNEDAFHSLPPNDIPPDTFSISPSAVDDDDRVAFDSALTPVNGLYVGDVSPEAATAQFSLGSAAAFPVGIITASSTSTTSGPITPSGIGDVITAPITPDLEFGDAGGGSSFSLEAWISREAFIGFGPGYFASIIDLQDGDGNGFRLGLNNDSLLLSGGDGGTDAIALLGEEGSFFQTNEFYHIVAVYDAITGKVQFYVDGEAVGGLLDYSLLTNSSDPLMRIGNDVFGFSPFVGIIDEVAIYGYALSHDAIVGHRNQGLEDSLLLPILGIDIDQAFAIPEPASVSLLILGLAGAAMRRRRDSVL